MNILELAHVKPEGVKSLPSGTYVFNGLLKGRILTPQQQIIFSKDIAAGVFDEMLVEIGWVPGALLAYVNSFQERDSKNWRVKWALQGLTEPGLAEMKAFNNLRPLHTLNFPVTADIFQDAKNA